VYHYSRCRTCALGDSCTSISCRYQYPFVVILSVGSLRVKRASKGNAHQSMFFEAVLFIKLCHLVTFGVTNGRNINYSPSLFLVCHLLSVKHNLYVL
jgi:hypothetical protein